MKKLIFILLLFVSFQSFGQNRFPSIDSAKAYTLKYYRNSTVETFSNYRGQNIAYGTLELLDSLAGNAAIDSIWIVDAATDTLKYRKAGVTYVVGAISGGGGAVSSVFGRTGAVTALAADYNSFFPVLSGTYNNPSWINQLAWSKITGTPTTLSGYGISDAQGALTLTTTGSSGAATLIGNTLNVPQYSGGGGGSNTWDSLRVFSVTAYGAKGDSSTNDRYAIQSAVDAAKAAGGGKVLFPSGDYRIDSTIRVDTSNIVFEGYGESSRIIATGDFGDILHFEPLAAKSMLNLFTGHQVKDLAIITEVTRTTGAIIHTKYTYRFSIINCKLGTIAINSAVKEWEGVRHELQSGFVINNSTIVARKYGVYLNGESGAGNINKLHWNGLITNNTLIFGEKITTTFVADSYGLYMAGSNGGLQIEQSNITWFEQGIRVDNSSGLGTNRELFIGHAFSGDDVGGAGIYIDQNSLNIFQMTGGWFAGTGRGTATPAAGVYVAPGSGALVTNITGGTFYENDRGPGIYIGRGSAKITGITTYQNDSTDIQLGANVTDATIVGNKFATFTNYSAITPIIRANSFSPIDEEITRSTTGTHSFIVKNSSAGTGANAALIAKNASNITASLIVTSATAVTNNSFQANSGYLEGGSGGTHISSAFGDIRFSTTGTFLPRLTIENAGNVYTTNSFGVGATPTVRFEVPGTSSSTSTAKIGSLEIQPFGVGNLFFGENVYYNGSNFVRRSAGAGALFYFQGPEVQYRLGATGSAGASITLNVPFKSHEDGRVGLGGNLSTTTGTYTGGTLFANSTAVGIGTNGTAPDASAKLEITSTTSGLLLPRMTATQASAISSPADGLIVYVTDTNGTFLAVGFWGRVSGTWTKMHL
jgi:hypothetical protein